MLTPVYALTDDDTLCKIEYWDNDDPQRRAALEAQWKRFTRQDPATGRSFQIWYRPTNRNLEVIVDHLMPPGCPPGRYRVEVFVPGKHATTRRAIFSVAHNFRFLNGVEQFEDPVTAVDMFDLFDVWHPLGEYDLDPVSNPLSGRVRQFDLSTEDPPAEAAFGPVRWTPLFSMPLPSGDGFSSPIGTQIERDGPFATGGVMFGKYPIWTGNWFDFNPYLSWYSLGYHTGADLNLPGPSHADRGQPIYAVGDGVVTFAGPAGSWGNIVVIEHPDAAVTLPDGTTRRQPVHSRYGHVEDRIFVSKGEPVKRGQFIASVGLPAGQVTGWHLHFDICYSGLLKTRPSHWPNLTEVRALQKAKVSPSNPKFQKAQLAIKREVIAHYIDPLKFIKDNHC